ncbi:tyrosine--tRNA ligase [Vulcanisaeta thermophila]|uniref:tyrosine--tRNA ligase n=1 Tax=Vulcanisaeta thermophila TaxID=867917 RepID=UPI000853A166|nr:tyrosine--tRNA ligase [Vulcanisaeta thermophila]
MDVEERLSLVMRYPTEEVLTPEELRQYFEMGVHLKHYIGFEISGFIHLGTGIVSLSKLVDLQRAGVEVSILLADIHSWLNNKLGGDLELIRRVANRYYVETFKRVIEVLGGDPGSVNFYMASDLYHNNDEYWYLILDLARMTNLADIRHSLTILGRKMGDSIPMSWLVYPLLQVADVFVIGSHIAHGGIDQRKAYVLAREVALKVRFFPLRINNEQVKPIALFHTLLPALNLTGKESREELSEMKMSKSLPDTAIFLHDTPDAIRQKILRAYCPPRETRTNPVIELAHLFAFREERREPFIIERPQEYGGGRLEFWSFDELVKAYGEGKIHPLDLKNAVINEVLRKMDPIIKWFQGGPGAKLIEEMNNIMRITR